MVEDNWSALTLTHCKCFVSRNRRCLSVIQIQKQTLINSTNICVWLITNIFMLFLSKFRCWIYWEMILEDIFHSFQIFSVFMLNMVIICYFHRYLSVIITFCFVCRNRRCLSAIQIQKQTLINSTNICVWLITNIFMLFLSMFSCWTYWEIITLC